MITQDIIRKLWDEAGNGNLAVWSDESITVVPHDYHVEPGKREPIAILKPIALVNRYAFLDFALKDEELLSTVEDTIRAGGGTITRERGN